MQLLHPMTMHHLYNKYGAGKSFKFTVNSDEQLWQRARLLGVVSNDNIEMATDDSVEIITKEPLVVKDAFELFGDMGFNTLDIRELDFSNLHNAPSMFVGVKINKLLVNENQFKNLTSARDMFKGATINCDLNMKFLGNNIVSMNGLFYGANLKQVKFGSKQLDKVEQAHRFLMNAKAKEVDLSKCKFKVISDLLGAFKGAHITKLKMPKLVANLGIMRGRETAFLKFKGFVELNGYEENHALLSGLKVGQYKL